jgi:lysozyme
MQTGQKGLDLIKQSEGFRNEAYPDPGTGGDPWTIGYGSTQWGEQAVCQGMRCTEEEATAQLQRDLTHIERDIASVVQVPLTQNQFDALVCFTYNVGFGNLKSSTLLKCVNQGAFDQVPEQFLRWNKAAGRVLPGLTKRRQAEADLFAS